MTIHNHRSVFATLSAAFVAAAFSNAVSAATLDLTLGGTNVPFAGALFTSGANTANVGTGVFGTFVQIQDNSTVTRAYNTTVNGVLDNGSSDNFNRSINYNEVSITTVGGTAYRQFNLDINEPNSAAARYLSLDDIEIYLSGTPNQSTTNRTTLGTLIYDLDQGGNNNILLDGNLNPGSGSGIDLVFLVPNSLFTAPNQFIYLYSQFGSEGNTANPADTRAFTAQAGFEEWSSAPCVSTPSAPCVPGNGTLPPVLIPEPGSLALIGLALVGLTGLRRKKA